MRCKACDRLLTDYEATRKLPDTEDYLDLCNECYSYIAEEVFTVDRTDLKDLVDEEEILPHDYDEDDLY